MELLDSEEDGYGSYEDIEVSDSFEVLDEPDPGLILDEDTRIHTDKDHEDISGNGSYDDSDTSVFQVLGPGRVQFIVDNPLDMETFWR